MLKTLLWQFWWLILLVAGVGLIKIFKPFLKGKAGELAVSAHVKLHLDEHYILLNDVTLPDESTGTTQIDHILLSPFGIFVIETKNSLYTTNFTEPLSYQDSAFLKLPKFP